MNDLADIDVLKSTWLIALHTYGCRRDHTATGVRATQRARTYGHPEANVGCRVAEAEPIWWLRSGSSHCSSTRQGCIVDASGRRLVALQTRSHTEGDRLINAGASRARRPTRCVVPLSSQSTVSLPQLCNAIRIFSLTRRYLSCVPHITSSLLGEIQERHKTRTTCEYNATIALQDMIWYDTMW